MGLDRYYTHINFCDITINEHTQCKLYVGYQHTNTHNYKVIYIEAICV